MLDFNIISWLLDCLMTILNDFLMPILNGILDATNIIDHIVNQQSTSGGGQDIVTMYVDEWGAKVVSALYTLTDTFFQKKSAIYTAQQLAGICVLFYIGYEMWPVIQGKKTPDVVALLRPILIAFIITHWTGYMSLLRKPGIAMTEQGQKFYKEQWNKMGNLSARCDKLQLQLNAIRDSLVADDLEKLRTIRENAMSYKDMDTNHVDGEDWIDWIGHEVGDLWDGKGFQWIDKIKNGMDATLAMIAEIMRKFMDDLAQQVMAWIEKIAKWISVIFLNFNFIGILMIGQIGMGVLGIVGPVLFALSITEVWHNSWAEWTMKYFAYSLYGWLAYTVMGYIYGLVFFEMQVYEANLHVAINNSVTADGLNAYASSTGRQFGLMMNWLVCLWVGGYAMKFVPELAGVICSAGGGSAASSAADAMRSGISGTVRAVGSVVK